jgi:hypothetical protein
MGVISAILANFGINFVNKEWFESHSAEALALLMLAVLSGYFIWETLRAKKEE